MIYRLVVLVRALPSGDVVAVPADFPGLAKHAHDAATAIERVRPLLSKELQRRWALERTGRSLVGDAELLRIPVEVHGDGEPITVTVATIVTPRKAGDQTVLLIRCPLVQGLEGTAPDRDRVVEFVTREAGRKMRNWPATNVLSVDESPESRIEVLELDIDEKETAPAKQEKEDEDDGDVLPRYGQELTSDVAALGRLDRRDDLVARALGLLSGPGSASLLLVGPPDVGKTALVHEIAARLASGDVPEALRGKKLWRASGNDLIADARYTGMWQGRFQRLVRELRDSGAICAMEDPTAIIDAGRWSGSDNNASRLLRPYVESGQIRIICECTPEVAEAASRKERSFIGSFHRIDVGEPSADDVRAIASAAASRLSAASAIEVAPDAVDAAIELTSRFEPYRGNPGKVIRLLQDCVRDRSDGLDRLDRQELTRAFARRTGLPLVLLSDDEPLSQSRVREHFETRVLGQPEGTAAMVDLVTVLKAGFSPRGKPLGSFFFVGPTGVGKTELAKALAEFLFGHRDRLIRFDMAEYAASDALPKLLGSGWREDDQGELTRRVREQPFCVVLLDEIEKAHSTVFDALLAVLGEGRLTDAAGQTTDFDNAIIVMTSNLGASRSKATLGFSGSSADAPDRLEHHYLETAERFFRPEFFNRLDRIVVFNPLDETIIRQIAKRELGRLLLRDGIVRRRLLVEIDDAAVDALATRGMHPRYGARPLQRAIERAVIAPLARLVVEQRPPAGSVVRVRSISDGQIAIDLDEVREAEPPKIVRKGPGVADEERTFTKAIAATAAFESVLEQEEATGVVTGLRGEVSALISLTHDPAFWDDNEAARSTLSRIYQLEHVLERLDSLRLRASGLSDMARQISASRARERLPEIWVALSEMDDTLALTRLELAGAMAGPGGRGALLIVTPVGQEAIGWAAELFEMYCSWAERTARDVTRLAERRNAARIEGLSTFDLLRGESGLHRRIYRDHRVALARVAVNPLDLAPQRDDEEIRAVIRVYEEGRRQLVRDPRTGTKETRVDAVIREGRLDPFLLAWLRSERDREAAPA